MDSKHFRKISQPNVYSSYKNVTVNEKQFQPDSKTTPDTRYPDWPAQMSDGRYTDYSPKCSQNVPSGEQYPTKQWLMHSGEQIVDYSRKHQMPYTRGLDKSVLPPPSQMLECTKYSCKLTNTNVSYGIGVERPSNTPYLFGTFGGEEFEEKPQDSKTTKLFEGGRNTPRGVQNNYSE